jgi:hypothetical protein
MNEDDFDRIVRDLRAERLPECPGNLRDTILRRVRGERSADTSDLFWVDLFRLAFRPQIAAGLLAMTAALGVMTTAVASQVTQSPVKPGDTLGFDVIANPYLLECYHHKSDWWRRD